MLNTANKILILLLCVFYLTACVQNAPYRTEIVLENCVITQVDCSRSIIEQHLAYDLTFIEFTERGNLYDRNRTRRVMDFIDKQANTKNGVAVFVFVHGWKHNASAKDSNVAQFHDFLSHAAENEVVGKRKVIGVYLGWRGKSSSIPILKESTYWARKSVAEEIGSGGATEVLSELHQILVRQFAYSDDQPSNATYKNNYVIIGHSFGGAIVLSALHDVLLNELIAATGGKRSENAIACQKVNRFSDGLVLLNPAIEANKIVLLKEAAARCRFGRDQPTLMHILSSDGDIANKHYFPIGQLANPTATLGPKRLKRTINGSTLVINERQLDTTTAGNLEQFRTSYLSFDRAQQSWRFDDCTPDASQCAIDLARHQQNHFPTASNDPLKFIKTDANFIKNHSDVFSCYVQSFITASIRETQSVDAAYLGEQGSVDQRRSARVPEYTFGSPEGCSPTEFDFKRCFNTQIDDYDCGLPLQ